MRSPQITVLAAILLTGCTLCEGPPPTHESHPEGSNFTAGIFAIGVEVETCYLETPWKEFIDLAPIDSSGDKYDFTPAEFTGCRVVIKDLNQNDNGIWTLRSRTTTGTEGIQSYNITVFEPLTTPEPEVTPPPEVIKESEVYVDNLPAEIINTTLGTNHTFFVREFFLGTINKCILITPEGQRIDLKSPDLPDVVKVISYPDAACAVNMIVKSDDVVGDWMLISDGISFSTPTERRLPFSIHVEEQVDASVDEVTLAEGNDFYIRLKNSIPNVGTCRLLGSNSSRNFEKDERFTSKCGFIVKEVTTTDSGTWKIQYGDKILYTARVVLNVNGNSTGDLPSLTWHRDDDINTTLGPEYAVYCRLESPSGRVVFDSFGRCRVVVNKVTMEHDGEWKMNIGVPGGVFTENFKVVVKVVERAHDTPATTSVIANKPVLIITCNATSRFPLRTCTFRNPRGNILLATEGVGQGRYIFHGDGSSYHNGLYSHECGFQITNPIVQDLGFWRCELKTEDAIHYGFLKVMASWLTRDPEVYASIPKEPTLSSSAVESRAGAGVVLRCSLAAPLRYCFFRNVNGTVFNVVPTSSNYEGGGFPSGECGIRFSSLEVTDSGAWSCHVGIDNEGSIEELRTFINVTVYDSMVARTYEISGALVVEARVHDNRALEYCRFVRGDGFGFTSVAVPPFYIDRSDLRNGLCSLRVGMPNLIDYRPWTVVARLVDGEEIARTASMIRVPRPVGTRYYGFSSIWLILIATGIIMIIISALIAPKKNRRWARERASALRNSFTKKPLPPSNVQNTACAA